VVTLSGYSGHADQAGLVEFAVGMQQAARATVLVHGELRAKIGLAEALGRRYEELEWATEIVIPSELA